MVPPEEVEVHAPTTLPADFGEWDGGADHPAQPAPVSATEGNSGGGAAKTPTKSATARVAVLPAASRPQSAAPRPPAPAYAEIEHVYQPVKPQGAKAGVSRQRAESEEPEKKTGTYAAIGVLVVLLAGGTLGYMKLRPKTVAPNQPVVTSTTAAANLLKPVPVGATNGKAPAAANQPAATDTTTNTDTDQPLVARSNEMNQQLNAPSRIQPDLRMLAGKEAPPSADFGAAGGESLNASGNVFSGGSGPKVKVAPQGKVTISNGVAVGLLVHQTNPVYPPIAVTARVSGTVVIQATISKNGTVGNLRAVSGPAMLRQSALDAVKTWRFRPYMLDGEPVEVDTTVNVTFALAQ